MRALLLALLVLAGPAAASELAPPTPAEASAPDRRDAPAGATPPLSAEEEQAIANLARWLEDPVEFYRDNFDPEDREPFDAWQLDAVRACAREKRVAMKACKGPGKTRVLAVFGWWCLALHTDANGFALSITGANLKANLWKEMGLLYARPSATWLQREFEVSGDRIYHRSAPLTWWLMARSFPSDADSTQQANTLAGLHARFVFVLADESSDYPDGVLAAADAIFANAEAGSEAHLVQAGNCTRSEGPLYHACTRDRDRWYVVEITGDPDDPKRSPRISLEYAQEMIAKWGREDPWVQTNLLGQFPRTQSDKLCGPEDITAAEARGCQAAEYQGEAIIWGLDVARFGADKSHLRKRQGPVLFRGCDFRGLDGPQLAAQVSAILKRAAEKDGRRPDALFVDVGGVGASAYDHLKLLGWSDIVFPVDFGGAADRPDMYADKRSEMWDRAARWVRTVGCLPSRSAELGRDLCAPTYEYRVVHRQTVKKLESKTEMKKRGLPSPDEGDAFALTFASETIVARPKAEQLAQAQAPGSGRTEDWDPYAERKA